MNLIYCPFTRRRNVQSYIPDITLPTHTVNNQPTEPKTTPPSKQSSDPPTAPQPPHPNPRTLPPAALQALQRPLPRPIEIQPRRAAHARLGVRARPCRRRVRVRVRVRGQGQGRSSRRRARARAARPRRRAAWGCFSLHCCGVSPPAGSAVAPSLRSCLCVTMCSVSGLR